MNRKTIAQYRQRLQSVLAKNDEGQRRTDLLQLAKDVGAGYVHTTLGPTTKIPSHKGPMGTIEETTIHRVFSANVKNLKNFRRGISAA